MRQERNLLIDTALAVHVPETVLPRRGRTRQPLVALLAALWLSLVSLPVEAQTGAKELDTRLMLATGSFDPLLETPTSSTSSVGEVAAHESPYWIVQFKDRLSRKETARLEEEYQLNLDEYIPNQAFLERLTAETVQKLQREELVRWVGPYQPAYKVDPELGNRTFVSPQRQSESGILLMVIGFADTDAEELANSVRDLGFTVRGITSEPEHGIVRLRIRVTNRAQAEEIARLPEIRWIEEMGDITLNNGTTSWVNQTNVNDSRTIWDQGLRGEGQIIGHIDGPIDINHCFFRDDDDNTVRPDHRKVVGFRNVQGTALDDHGSFSAGNAMGEDVGNDADAPTPNANNGNAPRARLTHGNLFDLAAAGGTSSFYDYLDAARQDGAFIHTNSWDDKSTSAYTQLSVDLDRFVWENEDHLVIIGPNNFNTIHPPDTSKNALVVNNTQQAPNQDNFSTGITMFTLDGRRKPDLMAPGTGIVSANGETSCGTKTDTGTSFAAPSVAGLAALVRQYYGEGWYPSGTQQTHHAFVPSGALLKATLLNATVDATGITGYPAAASAGEGWGRVLLENGLYFAGDALNSRVWDVRHASGLTNGEAHTYSITTVSAGQPLKITLVWNEPEAAANATAPVINDLDLSVTAPDGTTTFLGNVFSGGQSVTGGSADALNNVEQILLTAPVVGTYTITVAAGGSGVNEGTQGYALVATADTREPPVSTGDQDTLVVQVGLSDVLGGAPPSLSVVQNLMTDLASYISEVSYGQATVDPFYPAPITLDHPKSFYFHPSRNPLIEMTEEAIAKLIAADGNVFDRGTTDPADDIDRMILVLNDMAFTGDWATTGPWPYDLPGGLTRPISVSIQSRFNDPGARFAHGMSHQLNLVDLGAHPNVVFAQPHVDEWDNMALQSGAGNLAWSRERAGWLTAQGAAPIYIRRPEGTATANPTIGIDFLSTNNTDPKAIAIGLTEGAATLAEEDVFYWVEARSNAAGTVDETLPESGVLVYYVNENVPQGEGPVRLLDDLSSPSLTDAALEIGDSKAPAGTGLTITAQAGTGGADRNIVIAYDPLESDNDARITVGSPFWTSPDIWVDSQKDGFDEDLGRIPMDRGDQAVEGEVNRLYFRLRNPGPGDAFDFTVFVRVSEPYHTVGGSADFNRFVGQIHVPQLAASAELTPYLEWTPDEDGDSHSCVEVTLPNVFNDVNLHNNRAQQNLQELPSRTASPYEIVTYPFGLTNEEDHPQLFYFRAEGVPEGWSATLSPRSRLLMAGQRVDGTLTLQPPDDAPVCTEHRIHVTSWKPSGDTLVPVGGGTVQVDLRNRTDLHLETAVEDCQIHQEGPFFTGQLSATRLSATQPAADLPDSRFPQRGCRQITAQGCTNPVRANEKIIVRYEHPSGIPFYREVTTDALGCYADFLVVTEGGPWEVTAEYPGDDCSGATTTGVSVAGVPLPTPQDTDGDGLINEDESQGDHDRDGIPGIHDPDSDNDGVLDGEEPPGDCDRDGLANVVDPDSDNDGVLDGRDSTPCGGISIDRSRRSYSFHIGSAHPLSADLDNANADANIYAQLDLGLRLTDNWDVKWMLGLAQFTAETATGISDPRWLHGSVNLRRFFTTPSGLSPYLQGGPGIYRSKAGSNDGGFNLGFGAGIPLGSSFGLEFGADYHHLFDDSDSSFFTLQLGVSFR